MLYSSLLAITVLAAPINAEPPRGTFDSVVPRLPGGYSAGRVSLRVHTVAMPQSTAPGFVDELITRTGMAITETQGVRIEVVLPNDVQFESMHARVVDGLVLQPEKRSFFGRFGNAVVGLLRILLVGRLISATDDLAISGAAFAVALGAPKPEDELVRLSTSETLHVDRDSSTFSDHGDFTVCRAMLALSPWTELIDIQLRGRDRTSGEQVGFVIPRLSLHGDVTPEPTQAADLRLAMIAGLRR